MTPEESAAAMIAIHPFRFAASYRLPALMVGVRKSNSRVTVGPDDLVVQFGAWRLRTPLSNIADVQEGGDFGWFKTAGPPHLSLVDKGVTFATNGDVGVCVTFRTPVPAIDPTGLIKHPGATVTVADPPRLIAAIRAAISG